MCFGIVRAGRVILPDEGGGSKSDRALPIDNLKVLNVVEGWLWPRISPEPAERVASDGSDPEVSECDRHSFYTAEALWGGDSSPHRTLRGATGSIEGQ